MTKETLVKAVAAKAGTTQKEAARALDAFCEAVRDALAAGEEVKITGFGSFSVKERSARKGRDPRTGEELEIPARRAVVFRPGSELAAAVRGR
ncbi:HU family DNA-binding protein [Neomoorella mulderi]|uniref:DNA-binding protein HU 1 n=1 Tax=Moorella mulderi DSM 14980 TaxID=1122241 RepID=A0A151ASQ3_9FIRM|nr:HU family DNA-binding protein [Moorella mulderi]KYH30656.1 DNA-binding protein HU 1 [Moorella mulderi DSM 14980]